MCISSPSGVRREPQRREALGAPKCGDDPDHAAHALLQIDDHLWGHRVWQDVYHVPSEVGTLYVKFTADVVTEFLLLSFKEKDDE